MLFGEPFPSHGVVLCIIAYSHSRRQMFYRDNVWSQDWKASLMIPTALISRGNCFVIIHTWFEWGVDRSHHVPCWVLQNWALGEMIREEGLLSCHNLPTWQGLFSFYYCLLSFIKKHPSVWGSNKMWTVYCHNNSNNSNKSDKIPNHATCKKVCFNNILSMEPRICLSSYSLPWASNLCPEKWEMC